MQAEASLQSTKLCVPEGTWGTSWAERGSWALRRKCIAARSRLMEHKEKMAFRHLLGKETKRKRKQDWRSTEPKEKTNVSVGVTLAFELTKLGKTAGASCREDIQDLAKTQLQSTEKKKKRMLQSLLYVEEILYWCRVCIIETVPFGK